MTTTSILQCPISGSDLSFVAAERLNALRGQIAEGKFRHVTGNPVQMHLEAALSSPDEQFIYPVIDGILILLPSLAIVRTECASTSSSGELASATACVMRFYDEIGWKLGNSCDFHDAAQFEDLRPVSREYIRRCHLRVNDHISAHGGYLLDVASGPLQYPEYLTYSAGYERRICVDISIVALRAAKERLGDKGIYIQGDITRLPLKTACVGGFVSLHTIYHVPAEKQAAAFAELERVLAEGRTGVVVYTWGSHCLAMELLAMSFHPICAAKRLLRAVLPTSLIDRLKTISGTHRPANPTNPSSISDTPTPEPKLYFHPQNHRWFGREIASRGGWSVRVWRSVSVPFLRRYIHPQFLGTLLLSVLFRIETTFPWLFGRFGQYPMMVYRKAKPNEGTQMTARGATPQQFT